MLLLIFVINQEIDKTVPWDNGDFLEEEIAIVGEEIICFCSYYGHSFLSLFLFYVIDDISILIISIFVWKM